eukprot:96236-Rhodomonas_salina.1
MQSGKAAEENTEEHTRWMCNWAREVAAAREFRPEAAALSQIFPRHQPPGSPQHLQCERSAAPPAQTRQWALHPLAPPEESVVAHLELQVAGTVPQPYLQQSE